MFSDTEIGLVLAHDRELRSHTAQAQGLLDAKNSEIGLLRAALAKALEGQRIERAARIAAEAELDAVLRLVDEAL
jgi:hypothetical protein